MNDQQNFEAWRDELPNQRYGVAVKEAWDAGIASREKDGQYWDAESAARQMDKLTTELVSKQEEIDNWKIVAEDWRVKAVDWSRKNAELERRLRLIALEEYENPPVEPSEVYSPHVKVIK